MTIKKLYRDILVQIQAVYGLGEATVITDRLFESIASVTRSDLVKDPSRPLSKKTTVQLTEALKQIRRHRPVQYILGETWFYHLKLKVNEFVLIPRPETEELVGIVLSDRKSQLTDPSILDIGTGSGCIAVALKKNLPASNISATDISEWALKVAEENAVRHHSPINFIQMDFLDENKWDQLPSFDIIVSNPPYIPINEKEKLAKNVLDYEPHSALFVPENKPLLFYGKIAAFGKTHLRRDGKIYLETHEDHAGEVLALFKTEYGKVELKKDGFGKDRFVIASI